MDLASALELATDLRPRSRLLADLPLTFVTVPDKAAGDIYTEAMWDTYTRDNLNTGVWRTIAETTLIASASTIDFLSIPATFTHLLLITDLRGDAAVVNQAANVRFNNDSGANYQYELLQGSAAAVAASANAAQTSLALAAATGSTATAATSAASLILIPNYAAATFQKNALAMNGMEVAAALVQMFAGRWANAAAINRVTLLPGSGNFVAGSRATLVGVPS